MVSRMCGDVIDGFPFPKYVPSIPQLTEKDEEIYRVIKQVLLKEKSLNEVVFEKNEKSLELLLKETFREDVLFNIPPLSLPRLLKEEEREYVVEIFSRYLERFSKSSRDLAKIIVNDTFGLGIVDLLIEDENLEEIIINGPDTEIFVYHREKGMCITDIKLTKSEIYRIIKKVAITEGKILTEDSTFLDARLPNGDRFNAALRSVAPDGPAITIRKFEKKRFIIPELIRRGTMTVELGALLWLAVEGFGICPRNIIITGGAGAGKTSTLDALLDFVPADERLIVVEDTRELSLKFRKNWVSLVSKQGVSMDALLKNALRMRPERIIIGEVRGEEAETLFTAMDVGHSGTMGTLHANTSREVLLRLKSKPMNVPETLLPLMHLIVVQHRVKTKNGMVRRITEVSETAGMDDRVLISNIFKINPKTERIERTDIPLKMLDDFSSITGFSKKEVKEELKTRESLLRWAVENIKKKDDFIMFVNTYYAAPEKVCDRVGI